MNDYLGKSTLEDRLEAYLKSEDFGQDLYLKSREYMDAHTPVPSAELLWKQVIAEKRAWLEIYAVCESVGHAWEETAAPENGVSDFVCARCGRHYLLDAKEVRECISILTT